MIQALVAWEMASERKLHPPIRVMRSCTTDNPVDLDASLNKTRMLHQSDMF
jgi:hypothetical protein